MVGDDVAKEAKVEEDVNGSNNGYAKNTIHPRLHYAESPAMTRTFKKEEYDVNGIRQETPLHLQGQINELRYPFLLRCRHSLPNRRKGLRLPLSILPPQTSNRVTLSTDTIPTSTVEVVVIMYEIVEWTVQKEPPRMRIEHRYDTVCPFCNFPTVSEDILGVMVRPIEACTTNCGFSRFMDSNFGMVSHATVFWFFLCHILPFFMMTR